MIYIYVNISNDDSDNQRLSHSSLYGNARIRIILCILVSFFVCLVILAALVNTYGLSS